MPAGMPVEQVFAADAAAFEEGIRRLLEAPEVPEDDDP